MTILSRPSFRRFQMALIQNGMAKRAYESIEKEFPAFMGRVFEDICREYL